jgi:Right handed beta helix region
VPVEVGPAWFPGQPIYDGRDVRYADDQMSKAFGGAYPATLEGFTIVNTRYTVYAGGSADVRVAWNVFTNGIWVEGNATGLFEKNRMSRGGLYCAARGPVGPTWRENEFEAGAIDLGCRCRRGTWEGNTFANTGRTLFGSGKMTHYPLFVWAFAADDSVMVVNNRFDGSFFDGEGGRHSIRANTLMGPDYGVGLFYLGEGIVEENTVEDYSVGLDGNAEMQYNTTRRCNTGACVGLEPFHHNTILDSDNFGVRGFGGQVIEDNEIRGSRLGGIWLQGGNSSTVRRNLIWENGGDGIEFTWGVVEENIVFLNGGRGMCALGCFGVAIEQGLTAEIRRNTVVFNDEQAIRIGYTGVGAVEVTRNIMAFNGQEGFFCVNQAPELIVACNDAYGNAGGDYGGSCTEHSGADGNFSADPLFCDPSSNDFRISESSPCAPDQTECGLIGALAPGCTASIPWTRPLLQEAPQVETSTWGRVKTMFVRYGLRSSALPLTRRWLMKHGLWSTVVFGIMFLAPRAEAGSFVRVSKTGTATPPYQTAGDAFRNVQKAIDFLESQKRRGDTVYVHTGTYNFCARDTINFSTPFGDAPRLRIPEGVLINEDYELPEECEGDPWPPTATTDCHFKPLVIGYPIVLKAFGDGPVIFDGGSDTEIDPADSSTYLAKDWRGPWDQADTATVYAGRYFDRYPMVLVHVDTTKYDTIPEPQRLIVIDGIEIAHAGTYRGYPTGYSISGTPPTFVNRLNSTMGGAIQAWNTRVTIQNC